MGSWNETCALSHLPIHAGDQVMWLMLTEGRYIHDSEYGGRTAGFYPDTFWVPRNLPLIGTYDDYGRIEDEETGILQSMVLDGLRVDMVDGLQTPRLQINGIPAPAKKNLSFTNLLNWLGEGLVNADHNAVERQEDRDRCRRYREIDRLTVKVEKIAKKSGVEMGSGHVWASKKPKRLPIIKAPVISVMILKAVWDHLCSMPFSREGGGGFTPGVLKEHVVELATEIWEEGRQCRAAFKEDPLKAAKSQVFDRSRWTDALAEHTNPGLASLKWNFSFIGRDGGGPWTMSPGRQFRMACERLYEGTMEVDEAARVFERAIDFLAIQTHVHNMRITWGPTTGSGSQHSCLDTHLMFSKFVAGYAYEMDRRRLTKQIEQTKEFRRKHATSKKHYASELKELRGEVDFIDSIYTGTGVGVFAEPEKPVKGTKRKRH